jgi:hypothetical protein
VLREIFQELEGIWSDIKLEKLAVEGLMVSLLVIPVGIDQSLVQIKEEEFLFA